MNEEMLFHQALAKATPERAVFLAAACGDDAALRRHIEALLAAHDNPGSFLQQPALHLEPTPESELPQPHQQDSGHLSPGETSGPRSNTEGPGSRIGAYKLLQPIGEGGMGSVFLAEQTQPVQRKVALKVIKPGMDSRQVIARFEAERQALALMDHPHIARVLDAGTTGSGRPYFVMELVKGIPITRYCDERRLTPKERLELFIPVCQAVQHAHQKGIIHRDLKAANVLIALYDGKPVPKVIDFGIAKATGPKLTERTLFTEFGQVVGTLEYMSPEQAEFNQLDIDTRSDIYSLGVLLYELLTGTTPLDRKRLKGSSLLEVLRIIREEEPPRPSTRLSAAEGLPSIAASRGLEPRKLSGLVRGELDWIVMKALEKDRNRRYETANSLALDLQRYLADEPVQACPPSAGYRLSKFARRNKGAVLAVATILVLLLGGSIGTTIGLLRARAERDQKEQARQQAEAGFRTARQAVDRYYTRVSESVLLHEPTLEPLRKQLLEDALQYYQEFARQDTGDPEAVAELASANLRIARWIHGLGSQEDCLTPGQRAAEAVERLLQANAGIPASSSLRTGVLRPLAMGMPMPRPEEFRRMATQAIAAWEELVRREPAVPGYCNDLAVVYLVKAVAEHRMGEFAAGAASARRGSELLAGLVAEHPDVPHYRYGLAMARAVEVEALSPLGQVPAAEQAERQALELSRGLAAEFPDASAYKELHRWAAGLIASHHEAQGRFREAEALYREELEINEGLLQRYPTVPRYRINVLGAYAPLAEVVWAQGRRAEAAAVCRRAAAAAAGDAGAPDLLDAQAWVLATLPDPQFRDPGRAAALAGHLVKRAPGQQGFQLTLGAARYVQGDFPVAARALARAAELPTSNTATRGCIKLFQALAHGRLGERERGMTYYREAVALLDKSRYWDAQNRRLCAEAEQVLGLPPHRGAPESRRP
jgi:serine/threonine protein kinase/tetratricopeptide (TPR) repeat protein